VSQMGFKFSDENIYFYMGNLILQGQLPYQDFFFASPPLQIGIIALFLSIFGSKIILLKLLPIIASIITSIFLFLILKKKFNSISGLLASTLYLFSFVVLTTTDHFTGIHLTTMFIIISCYFIYKQKYLLAGMIASLALLTRLYAGIAILGLLIYLIIKNKKALLKFISGIAIIFIPANLILLSIFKQNYLNSVFLYHFLKSTGIPKINIFKFFIKWDFILVTLATISLFIKSRKKLLLPIITAATITLFYLIYIDIYYLYLGLLIPFLAILGSKTVYTFIKNINLKKKIFLILFLLLLLMIPSTFFYLKNQAQTAKVEFNKEIVEFVKDNTQPQETIYGNFEITPLIALEANRKITGNYVDTNEKTFLSGLYNTTQRTNELRGNVTLVLMKTILDKNQNPLYFEEIIDPNFLLEECNLTKIYQIENDYSDNAVVIFKC